MKFIENFVCLIAALWLMILLAFLPRPAVGFIVSLATAVCCIARYWRAEDGTDDPVCGICDRTIEKGGALAPFIATGLAAQASMVAASRIGLAAEIGLLAFSAVMAVLAYRLRISADLAMDCPECGRPLRPDPVRMLFSRPS